jgi:PKD repeat protein
VTIATPPTANFTSVPTSGCLPLTVQFTSTSSANTTAYNWSFPGGNPATSTVANPSVVYAAAGTYNVSLIVSNPTGSDTLTKTNLITVGTVPGASFTSASNGLTVNFTNNTTNATTYSWNFGDGGNSTATNPSHTYTADGTYTVVLTATNTCGTSTSTKTVTVLTGPTASFTSNVTSGCAALTVQFTSTSSSNSTNFNWEFPGGSPATSTEQNPLVVYNTPGVYSVTLTVSNGAGNATSTQNNYINVSNTPSANFNATVAGSVASFNNTSANAQSYAWNFGDGTSATEANPTHIYLTDGTYTVELTATNSCGSSTFTQIVTVVTPPTAAFTTSGTIGCAPFTVEFTNTSSANANTFNWDFPNGNPSSSTEQNPKTVWNQPGVYTVSLTVTNAAGSSTTSTNITVGAQPSPSFTYSLAGTTVTLTNASSNANSYTWDFGDGQVSNATNPTHTYANPGDYVITLNASNGCGTVSFIQNVSIAGAPPVAAFTAGEANGCVPFTVTFSDQSAGNPTAWNWTFQGGNPPSSTAQNPSVTYSAPGTYGVSLTVVNAFGSNTLTLTDYIHTQGLPAASFTFVTNQGTVAFSNFSFNAVSYTWNFGDGTTSNLENPSHTYAASGTYNVELTAVNACGASTLQQTISVVVVGTQTPNWLEVFRVYPNPNNGVFNVEMKGAAEEEVEFTLYNTLGGLIKREMVDYSNGNLLHAFQYGDLPSGVYNLRVRSGARSAYVQIAIQ